MNSVNNDMNIPEDERNLAYCYGFGAFEPIADDDLFTHFLSATNYWEAVQNISLRASQYTNGISIGSEDNIFATPGRSIFFQRGYKKSDHAIGSGRKVSLEYELAPSGNTNSYSVSAETMGGLLLQTPLIIEIVSTSKLLPRGFLPLIKTIPHQVSYTDIQLVEQGGKAYLAKKIYGNTNIPHGTVMFDLGET